MTTLWRYVAARFLRAFLASLLILGLAFLVVYMLLYIEDTSSGEAELAGIVQALLLGVASDFLPFLVPLASFTGAFASMGLLARNRELVAMRAGGVSPFRVVLPVFVLALPISLLAAAMNEIVTVRARAEEARRERGETGEIALRSGRIWYHTGRFIYNIEAADGEAESVTGIEVFERDARGRLVRRIEATGARRLAPHRWRFTDATVRSFDPDAPDRPPRIERSPEITLELAEDRSPRTLEDEISSLPVWSLARYLRDRPDNPRARQALHERLTPPLGVLLLVWIAVPLGMRVEQTRSLALPALEGVFALLVLLAAREYGATLLARAGASWAVPWLLLGGLSGYGAWRLVRAGR